MGCRGVCSFGHRGVLTGLDDQGIHAALHNDDDGASSHRMKAQPSMPSRFFWVVDCTRINVANIMIEETQAELYP